MRVLIKTLILGLAGVFTFVWSASATNTYTVTDFNAQSSGSGTGAELGIEMNVMDSGSGMGMAAVVLSFPAGSAIAFPGGAAGSALTLVDGIGTASEVLTVGEVLASGAILVCAGAGAAWLAYQGWVGLGCPGAAVSCSGGAPTKASPYPLTNGVPQYGFNWPAQGSPYPVGTGGTSCNANCGGTTGYTNTVVVDGTYCSSCTRPSGYAGGGPPCGFSVSGYGNYGCNLTPGPGGACTQSANTTYHCVIQCNNSTVDGYQVAESTLAGKPYTMSDAQIAAAMQQAILAGNPYALNIATNALNAYGNALANGPSEYDSATQAQIAALQADLAAALSTSQKSALDGNTSPNQGLTEADVSQGVEQGENAHDIDVANGFAPGLGVTVQNWPSNLASSSVHVTVDNPSTGGSTLTDAGIVTDIETAMTAENGAPVTPGNPTSPSVPTLPAVVPSDKLSLTSILNDFYSNLMNIPILSILNQVVPSGWQADGGGSSDARRAFKRGAAGSRSAMDDSSGGSSVVTLALPEMMGGSITVDFAQYESTLDTIGSFLSLIVGIQWTFWLFMGRGGG